MNDPTNHPQSPDHRDTAWESAMSRDFDARVRDLHEAPLDLGAVRGRARAVRRNRRVAVAGGLLGVAAVLTPIAILTAGGDTSDEPDFAPDEAPTQVGAIDYVLDGVWHQGDGDRVDLPEQPTAYVSAVLWGDRLVASRYDGEAFFIADVIDESGDVVRSFPAVGPATGPVAVDDAGGTIAWIDSDGTVMTAWDGGETSLGEVDLAAAGEGIVWTVGAVRGGPDCDREESGCLVVLNHELLPQQEARMFSAGGASDIVAPGVLRVFDLGPDSTMTVVTEIHDDRTTCGGLFAQDANEIRWDSCDHQARLISPDGEHVVAPATRFDGFGPSRLTILDSASGEVTGRFDRDDWHLRAMTWTDGAVLFDAYDGQRWHLMTLTPDGAVEEVGDPVAGNEFQSPFIVVAR